MHESLLLASVTEAPAETQSQKQRTGVSAPHVRQKPFSRLSLLHENVSRIFPSDDSDDFESELVEIDSGE